MRGDCNEGEIRLIGGTILSGRLEVCLNNAWGTVCEEGFTADDAQVVCNQTGLPHNGRDAAKPHTSLYTPYSIGVNVFRNDTFGIGSEPIFLTGVSCTGTETRLLDCNYHTVHSCIHSDDISIQCIGELILIGVV